MHKGEWLAFPDPVQIREHPISCRRIPQHMRLWRVRQPGWNNSEGIPKERESKQKTTYGMGAGNRLQGLQSDTAGAGN